jgi:hypothetical protein
MVVWAVSIVGSVLLIGGIHFVAVMCEYQKGA